MNVNICNLAPKKYRILVGPRQIIQGPIKPLTLANLIYYSLHSMSCFPKILYKLYYMLMIIRFDDNIYEIDELRWLKI